MMKLDETDLRILEILQKNGRITNVQLSGEVGLSPAPTLERVKKLEQLGYIESYSARLNPQKLGLGVVVFMEISFQLNMIQSIEETIGKIAQLPEVVECYQVTGDADFLLKIYTSTLEHFRQLVNQKILPMAHLRHMHSRVVLDTVKYNLSLPLPEQL